MRKNRLEKTLFSWYINRIKYLLIGRNPGEPCEIHGLSRNCEPHGAASQIPAPFKFPPPDGGIVPETQDGESMADCRFLPHGGMLTVAPPCRHVRVPAQKKKGRATWSK